VEVERKDLKSDKEMRKKDGGVAQVQTICLASMRPRVQIPV
jgi:hypothetical protein